MAEKDILNNPELQAFLLAYFKGKDISLDDIQREIRGNLRGLYQSGKVSFNKQVGKFSFPFVDSDNELETFFGPNPRDNEAVLSKDKADSSNYLGHINSLAANKQSQYKDKPYYAYIETIERLFNATRIYAEESEILFLACLMFAHKQITSVDYPIPGNSSDKKHWVSSARKALENYSLGQLEIMIPIALKEHLGNNLSFHSPDSIGYLYGQTYVHCMKIAKSQKRRNVTKDDSDILPIDPIDTLMNFARGRNRLKKNLKVMHGGYVFQSQVDMDSVIKAKNLSVDTDSEQEIIELLLAGKLWLSSPFPMTMFGDMFFLRTVKTDYLLAQAYIFTQRALYPKLDLTRLRLQKNKPLGYDLETANLPEFYNKGEFASE